MTDKQVQQNENINEKDESQTNLSIERSCLAKAGKYLTFSVGNEEYGFEILKVMEIIGIMDITAIPHVPQYVKGVINLRGKVIPVLSLRKKFNMPEIEYDSETCIINVNVNNLLIGIVIDRVLEVLDIEEENIEPPPSSDIAGNTDFILGMGKVGDKVKILLNIDKILTDDLKVIGGIKKDVED